MNQPKGYIFESRIAVRDYEIDSQGIVNNANYLHYLEMTRHDFCVAHGTSFHEMASMGMDPVVKSIKIEYNTPLKMGDVMVSRLNLIRKGPKFIFTQDIYREHDNSLVVAAEVTVVCLENGKLSRGDRMASLFSDLL